jgi:drug/metabolite transporter (DMT)-like permease
MAIAKVVSLHFTLPLFGIVGAAIFLREGVGAHRWIGAAVGFLGVLIILRPGMIPVNEVALLVLASAAGYALSDLALKSLVRTEPPDLLVFMLSVLHAPMALIMIPLVSEWVTPTWREIGFMIAIGVCGVLAHMCSTRAFRAVDASYVMLLSFMRMPIVAFGAYLLFGETVDAFTILGAVVIFGAAYYATERERRAAPA